MRILLTASIQERTEKGALDCLSVCKALNGRVRARRHQTSCLSSERRCSGGQHCLMVVKSGLSVATCQSSSTCPAGKRSRSGEARENWLCCQLSLSHCCLFKLRSSRAAAFNVINVSTNSEAYTSNHGSLCLSPLVTLPQPAGRVSNQWTLRL